MPDLSNIPCAKCMYKDRGIYVNPCKKCTDEKNYPAFFEDFRLKVLTTEKIKIKREKEENYFNIGEFKLVD